MPFDTRPTEPAESTELDDVHSFIEQAYAARATLSELAISLIGNDARPPVLDAIVELDSAIESLEMRRRALDGTDAAESRADRIYDEMRDEGWR
jgi:hypothetical protein